MGRRPTLVLGIGFTVCFLAASGAADNAAEIEAFCTSNWPNDVEQQRLCQDRQHAAAREIISGVEAARKGSRVYTVAQTCIERAKVKQPARIDWMKALNCFKNRSAASSRSPEAR